MVKWFASRVVWGFLLIFGGILFMLQNIFGWEFGGLFWAVVFGLAGLAFLTVFINDRQAWWGLIPGFILLGIGALIGLSAFSERAAEVWGGPLVLGSIGLAFVGVYLAKRDAWWPLIPAGVMVTLALVAGLERSIAGFELGGVFFLGLGLTFALVAVIPGVGSGRQWAWIPAGILILIGVLISFASGRAMGYIGPLILIGLGILLILRNFVFRKE